MSADGFSRDPRARRAEAAASRGFLARPLLDIIVMLRNAILILCLTLAASCAMLDEDGDATPIIRDGCFVVGCSSQLCSDRSDVVTTCEWRPEYGCFQAATCERQAATGACDWTPTPALQACLAGELSPARRTIPRR